MAKKQENNLLITTPGSTIVDVVCTKGSVVKIATMAYENAITITKKPGWKYQFFQPGFHSYKETNGNTGKN